VDGGFEYDDLYLDVWQVPGHQPELLDEDELEEAVAAGYVTKGDAAEARRVAKQVMQTLSV
jgi:predicted RNA-binding protein associated with RNAse of E/G family